MKYSQIKQIKADCSDIGVDDWKQVIIEMDNGTNDFTVDNYQFIHKEDIDRIFEDSLSSDAYMLGCFTSWFIADNSSLSFDIVEALQEAGKYEAIGQHIIDNDDLTTFAEAAISADGYGHFFGHYDGNEYEIGSYYAFRVN